MRVLLVPRQTLRLANLRELSLGRLLGLDLLRGLRGLDLLLGRRVDQVLEQAEDSALERLAPRHAPWAFVRQTVRLLEHVAAFLELELVRFLVFVVVEGFLRGVVDDGGGFDPRRVLRVGFFVLVLVGGADAVVGEPEGVILEDALELSFEVALGPRREAVAE